jgi:hypothetical protein
LEGGDAILCPFPLLSALHIVEYVFIPSDFQKIPLAYRCYVPNEINKQEVVNFLLDECSKRTRVHRDDLALLYLIDGKPCEISQLQLERSKICIYQLQQIKEGNEKKNYNICVVNVLSQSQAAIQIPYVSRSGVDKVCVFIMCW